MSVPSGVQSNWGYSSSFWGVPSAKDTKSPSTTTTTTTMTTTTTAAPDKAPAPAPSIVSGLTRELDELFLRAAQTSTQAVDVQKLEDTVRAAGIDKATCDSIMAAATLAKDTFVALSGFSGRQLADAIEGNGDAAQAFQAALDAQADLSDKLRDAINSGASRKFSGIFGDIALQCDRRQSEIITLASQLADAVRKSDDDPDVAARLDATLEEMLPRQALAMHGNASALERIKKQMKPLVDKLTAFAQKPNASLKSRELASYASKLDSFAAALEHAAKNGFPAGKGRMMPDKDFLLAAAEMARSAKSTVVDARTEVGMRSLKAFASKAFSLPSGYPSFLSGKDLETDSDSLDTEIAHITTLAPTYEHLERAARCRLKIVALAQKYAANPDDETLAEMRKTATELSTVDRIKLRDDIDNYQRTEFASGSFCQKLKDELASTMAMLAQVEHLAVMARNVQAGVSSEKFLTTTSARALLEGKLQFSTLVEARINGMSDGDVNPELDDSRVVSSAQLGQGMANTVYLVGYSDDSEYVFKPEGPGRTGMERILLTQDYEPQQQVAQLNLATQRTADALGLGDVMPKTSVGCHNGDYGIFMEKAPGVTAEQLASGAKPKTPGTIGVEELKSLSHDDFQIVVGRLLRELNRLEWLDLVTGQGDRHNANYLVEVKSDLTVTVKGIDNDACFPAYRTGLRTFVLTSSQREQFEEACREISLLYPDNVSGSVVGRIKGDESITREKGKMVIDAGKIKAGEMYAALKGTIGVQTVALPGFIDADLYKELTALKSGSKRKRFQAELTSRLPADCVAAAMSRLDEAIALAESLRAAGKVIARQDFEKHDVQKQIVAGRIVDPKTLVKDVPGEVPPPPSSSVFGSTNLVQSLFFRDIFPHLGNPDWFD